jgi:hypothetical protein
MPVRPSRRHRQSLRDFPPILDLWLEKTGPYAAKGQPQLQDRGCS